MTWKIESPSAEDPAQLVTVFDGNDYNFFADFDNPNIAPNEFEIFYPFDVGYRAGQVLTLTFSSADGNDVEVLGDSSSNTPYFATRFQAQTFENIYPTDDTASDAIHTWSASKIDTEIDARITGNAVSEYDLYVDADYVGSTMTGSQANPFNNLSDAITASSAGNSIFIKGVLSVANSSTDAYTLPHGLAFYGAEDAVIKYASYDATNGDLFYFNGTDNTQEFRFDNLSIQNAGGYGIYIKKPLSVIVKDCDLQFNGWNGTGLNTILPSATSGVLGYDSTQAQLQAFYAGSNASNGGAMRIEESPQVEIVANSVSNNLRGIRLQDCGIGGYGYVSRNNAFNNIETGIYLASSTYNTNAGCENFAVYNNASKFNANNGVLCIGGINNVIALNHIEGNWNAGVMPWHVANTIIRDDYLLNNNRSEFNGIGNTGDAGASLEIAGGTLRSAAKFIVHAINNQIVDTGLGNATTSNGVRLSDSLDGINDRTRSIILLDNNTMQGQDYALVKACDLDEIRLTKGDNTYIDSAIEDTLTTGTGSYNELPYSNQHTDAKTLDFSVDATGGEVAVKDSDDKVINYYGINQLRAVEFQSNIRIILKDSDKVQFDDVPPTGVSIDGTALTGTTADKVNAINALVQASGAPGSELPSITSSLAISLVEGQTLNYELTADFGVGYEWDLSNVSGVTTVEGNVRKIIGGSSLAVGTYSIPVKAINYNGEDSETITLTVSTPPFSNTKSVNFNNLDYLGANASLLDAELGRTGNGSGASDAWSISFWFKPSTNSSGQTIFYFGDNDITNAGHINLRFLGGNDNLRLQYGSNNNFLRFQSATNSLSPNQWHHILVTYNGGTTGASSAGMADYYSRFKVFINGSNAISGGTWSHNNFGYTGGIDPDNLRVGRYASGNYLKDNTRVDELAIWGSDQSANISDIYNSGTPFDLDTLSVSPAHWWRMGDGDNYPNLQDSVGNATFVMYNMTSADIVTDTP